MSKLAVNQKLWFVSSGRSARTRGQGEVTVTKAGHKWAYVDGFFEGRIDVDSLVADGGSYSPPGKCYASEAAWRAEEGPRIAWTALRSAMPIDCPGSVTTEQIVAAGKLLGIDIDSVLPA